MNAITNTFTAVPPTAVTPDTKPIAPALGKAALAQVWEAANTSAMADLTLQEAKKVYVRALLAAGIADLSKITAIHARFVEDYCVVRMFPGVKNPSDSERDAVRAMLAKKGADTAKGDKRTLAEEGIYGKARVAWGRAKDACLNPDKKTGSHKREDGQPAETKSTPAPDEAARPNNPNEVVTMVHRQAATLMAYVQKHVVTFKGAAPLHALTNVTNTFLNDVAKLVAQAAPEEETTEE